MNKKLGKIEGKSNKYRDLRMDPELRKIRREMIKNMDSLLESLAEAILERNIFIFATEDVIQEELINENNLNIEHVLEEHMRFRYEKESRSLVLLHKDEDLKNFINDNCDREIDLDKLVGLSLSKDKITDIVEIEDFQIKDNDFNKENIKKIMNKILPTVDEMIMALDKQVFEEFTGNIIIDGIVSLATKNEPNRKVNQEKRDKVCKESSRRTTRSK